MLIGSATNVDHSQEAYNYSLIWQTPPPSGSYRIYAKTSEGITTKKIMVSIP